MSKVLEIESDLPSQIDLPVTSFPPFKLRSSMVDKDPVIWVHLIEVYIHYIKTLLQIKIPLTQRSEQQLCLFVKTYLHEIAWEQGQILSLGLINVDITRNLDELRKWVFELIKRFGVLNLKLNGEALWDIVRIYGLNNSISTRGLIDGSLKPNDKKTINSIGLVHKHIEHLIGNSKFTNLDLQILAVILNDHNPKTTKSNSKEKTVKKKKDRVTPFGEKFITASWIEMLDKFYSKGEGLFADLSKKIALLSLLPLSISKIASLATELGATSIHTLKLFPLLAGIVTSPKFQLENPGLEKKLPFLTKRASKQPVNQDDVNTLVDLFPNLTISHTEKLLRKHKTVETITNLLLENPEMAIEKEKPSRFKGNDSIEIIPKKVISKHTSHVPDEHKNKTLSAALKLIYEADEDERDDTYDEAEASSNSANASNAAADAKIDAIEKFLWDFFKKDQTIFDRSERKLRIRKEMKEQTRWSDEQIEGWARMLQKSPKRVQLLEEKYFFRGNKPWNSSFAFEPEPNEDIDVKQEGPQDERPKHKNNSSNGANKTNANDKTKVKKQQARNEKNKSAKANHNRKSGHDKKMSRGFN